MSWFIFVPFTLLWLVPTVFADTPVVCASGSGNVSAGSFDLTTCGAPNDRPVLVELSAAAGFMSPQIGLAEGAQGCNIFVSDNSTCAVMVSDGTLDSWQVSNTPQNYRLTAQWDSGSVGSVPITDTQILASNTFTLSLTSGDVFTVRREFSYGDVAVVSLVIFGLIIFVLKLLLSQIRSE